MNYSVGGFDQDFIAALQNSIVPSPYGQMVARDPSAMGATTELVGRLAHPNDVAHGTNPVAMPSQDSDPWDTAGRIAKGILTSPLRVLGYGLDTLGDALGSPASQKRHQREAMVGSLDRLGLLDESLTDEQKIAIGYNPQDVAAMRAYYTAREKVGNGTDGAHGVDTSVLPLPQSRKTSVLGFFSGEDQRAQEAQAARAAAVRAALLQNTDAEKLRGLQADTRSRNASAEGQEYQNQLGYRYGDAEHQMTLDKGKSELETQALNRTYLNAQIGNIGADNARASAAEARQAEADRRAAEEHVLAMKDARLGLREKLLKYRREKALGPYGENTGYDRLGLPFDINKADAALRAANTDEERATVRRRYGVDDVTTGGVDVPLFGNIGGTTATNWNAARLRRPGQPDAGVAPDTANNQPAQPITAPPSQQDVVNIRRALAPRMIGKSPAEIQRRSEEVASIAQGLPRSSRSAFVDAAIDRGLSDTEIEVL